MIYLCTRIGLYLSTQTAQDISLPIHTDRPTQAYNKHTIHIGLHKPIINTIHIGLRLNNTYRPSPVYINKHTYIASICKHAHAYILPYIGLRLYTTYRPIQAHIPHHTYRPTCTYLYKSKIYLSLYEHIHIGLHNLYNFRPTMTYCHTRKIKKHYTIIKSQYSHREEF